MLKLLFKFVLPIALMLAACLVGYNYFWGDAEEKQNSQRIIGKFSDLTGEIVGLLRSEHEKYDEGKFDDALQKISERIASLKEKASSATSGGSELMNQVQRLEQAKESLESKISNLKSSQDGSGSGGGRMMSSGSPAYGSSASPPPEPVTAEDIGAELERLAADTQQVSSSFKN